MGSATKRTSSELGPPRWLIGAGAAGLALAAAFGLGYRAVERHVTGDASWCATCHATRTQLEMWAQSEHHSLACQQCHAESAEEALTTMARFVSRSGEESFVHAPRVSANACLVCHADEVGDWPQIGRSVGHRKHLADVEIDCLTCHGEQIHGFGGALKSCDRCHSRQVAEISGMEREHCNACHNFLDEGHTLLPTQRVCNDCHEERGVELTELAAHTRSQRCSRCHEVHGLAAEVVP